MPSLNDMTMEEKNMPNTSFGYSATRIEELGAMEYTLVVILCDVSYSVEAYSSDMEKALKSIINACKLSPRSDNLMIRFVVFNNTVDEIHGYKLLENCDLDDYEGVLRPYGATALFDATENAIQAQADYSKVLTDEDYDVNSIMFILTDGDDNRSAATATSVKNALHRTMQEECTSHQLSVLIGVGVGGNPDVAQYLSDFQKTAEITKYIETQDTNPKTLAKIAEFVSKLISAQSQSLQTGQSVSLSI